MVWGKVIKIAILLAIPVIMWAVWFYPKSFSLPITKEGNETFINVPDFAELNEKAGMGLGRMLRTILATPFDLKYYVITVKDISVYDGPKGGLGYHLYLDGKELEFMKAGGKTRTTVLTNKKHILKTKLKLSQGDAPSGSHVSFKIDFAVSARPSWYDVIAKLVLILVAWNGIIFLGKEVYNFIKK